MRKPEWVTEKTLISTTNHHKEEVWIEEHELEHFYKGHKESERVYLVVDTSGSDYGYGEPGLAGVHETFADASNAIGEEYGFDEWWKKI